MMRGMARSPAGGRPGERRRPRPGRAARRCRRAPCSGRGPRSTVALAGSAARKCGDRERPVEQHLQRADLLAARRQPQRRLPRRLGAGPHRNDDALRLRMPVVAEQAVGAAAERGQPVHFGLNDAGRRRVVGARRLPRLEEGVGIVGGAAHHRMRRAERPVAMRPHQGRVDHRPDGVVGEERQAVDLVRGAEPVHEVDEGHARPERRRLGDQPRGRAPPAPSSPRASRSRRSAPPSRPGGRRRSTAPASRSPAPRHASPSASARRRS